jgi:hypothetical protein
MRGFVGQGDIPSFKLTELISIGFVHTQNKPRTLSKVRFRWEMRRVGFVKLLQANLSH